MSVDRETPNDAYQPTRKGKTLLPGHTLEYEGRAYHQPSCGLCAIARRAANWHSTVGEGHGLCSCGTQSEHLSSGAARKRWHAAHKDEIRQLLANGDSPRNEATS